MDVSIFTETAGKLCGRPFRLTKHVYPFGALEWKDYVLNKTYS